MTVTLTAATGGPLAVRLILFDLDDTLFDTHSGAEEALAASTRLARERHPELGEAEVRQAFGRVLLETEDQLAHGTLEVSPAAELKIADLYRHRWERVLAACAVDIDHADALADRYLT